MEAEVYSLKTRKACVPRSPTAPYWVTEGKTGGDEASMALTYPSQACPQHSGVGKQENDAAIPERRSAEGQSIRSL